jgi:hypothetical protein
MLSARALLYCAPFMLGIWGCTQASAAEGSQTSSRGALVALAASATQSPLPPSPLADPPPPHKPPPQAFDACKSLTEGATCTVSFDGHTMTGTCRKGPHGESELACVPEHPPGPPPSDSNQALTGSALERKLDQLEREIRGS